MSCKLHYIPLVIIIIIIIIVIIIIIMIVIIIIAIKTTDINFHLLLPYISVIHMYAVRLRAKLTAESN